MTGHTYSLREARILSGLSQAELADKIGVKMQVISTYETGKNSPTVHKAIALIDALNEAAAGKYEFNFKNVEFPTEYTPRKKRG